MDEINAPIFTGTNKNPDPEVTTPEETENPPQDESEAENNTFPRSYVEELRKESAKHRDRAKQAEDRAETLAKQLHRELVRATGRLENPADLPYAAEHVDDPEKLVEAIDALLADRPYFAKRKVAGDIGQGNRGNAAEPVSLLNLLKGAV